MDMVTIDPTIIFLDTHDLINCIERGRPMSASELGDELSRRGWYLALTFSSVAELIPPREHLKDSVLRRTMDRLENIPRTYIRQVTIVPNEIREAVSSFNEARSVRQHNPFVTSWWRTFWKAMPGTWDLIVDEDSALMDSMSLGQLVSEFSNAVDDPRFGVSHVGKLKEVMDDDRKMRGERVSRDGLARGFIRKANFWGIAPPADESAFFARLLSDTKIAPSWRFGWEVFQEFSRDRSRIPRRSDFYDFAHLEITPYVSYATTDRNWLTYAMRAGERLEREGRQSLYHNRLFPNLKELIRKTT